MEQILRGETLAEIDKEVEDILSGARFEEIYGQAFSMENQVVYFPVRHHSPACAYHLMTVIEEYNPDCILIEGPEGANELLPLMADNDTQAPFAVYYSYKDSSGAVSGEKKEYKCYYPFLDYSPELVAIREGSSRNVHTAFFDLPYGEILAASEENRGLRRNEEKNNYNDDYYLSASLFMKRLVEKSGFRSFDELWEKYFEIDGILQSHGEFVRNMLYYCVLSRLTSREGDLKEEGCMAREAYMRKNIEQARKSFHKILVVTGGFHTYGLLYGNEQYSLHNIPKDNQAVYLMSYSMEAADALNGYASGMPYPAFYQEIWEGILEREKAPEQVYEDTALKFLVSVGKAVRKKEGYPSTYDEICAYHMAGGLARLRGKRCMGAYELADSVLSSYVKGEYTMATDLPMRTLAKELTGKQIGRLCKNAKVPPLVQDFEEMCKKYRLKIGSTIKTELTLNIFSSERHRQMSEFFYQMDYLNTGFVSLVKGPNLRMRKDKNLIREIWSYKWSTQVIAALIDASVYGGTLPEAAISKIKSGFRENISSQAASELLIRIFEMGLKSQLGDAFIRMEKLISEDGDFFSLVKTFSNLIMLEELSALYRSELDVTGLLKSVYRKIMTSLPHMAGIKEENVSETMTALKTLFTILNRPCYREDRQVFCETLSDLLERDGLNPSLEGCAMGILYGLGCLDAESIGRKCAGYMSGTKEKQKSIANVFHGLFYTARDLLFSSDDYIKIIDDFIAGTDERDFMQALPGFRLAFGYFTPVETDKISGRVAALYNVGQQTFENLKNVTPEESRYGKELEKYVLERMKAYGR